MTDPQKQNAPDRLQPVEGRNTTSTQQSTEETFDMSMTDGTDSVQPRPALAAWTALADDTVWSMHEGAADPISAGFTRPAWDVNGEPGQVLPVQTSSAERVSMSEVAAVPLLAYRGKVLGGRVDFSTAQVHLRHRHTHREPTVQLDRHWYGQAEDAAALGETSELLTLRPAEARQLGALLVAAADLADDHDPAPTSAAVTTAQVKAGDLRERIDAALQEALDRADDEGAAWHTADAGAGADDVELHKARARTAEASAAVMDLVDEALAVRALGGRGAREADAPQDGVIDLRDRVGEVLDGFLERAATQNAVLSATKYDGGADDAALLRAVDATRVGARYVIDLIDAVLAAKVEPAPAAAASITSTDLDEVLCASQDLRRHHDEATAPDADLVDLRDEVSQ